MSDDRRTLTRTVKVGETLAFDNGRIVIELLERTGRNASRIRFNLAPDVIVNKPDPRWAARFAAEGIA